MWWWRWSWRGMKPGQHTERLPRMRRRRKSEWARGGGELVLEARSTPRATYDARALISVRQAPYDGGKLRITVWDCDPTLVEVYLAPEPYRPGAQVPRYRDGRREPVAPRTEATGAYEVLHRIPGQDTGEHERVVA